MPELLWLSWVRCESRTVCRWAVHLGCQAAVQAGCLHSKGYGSVGQARPRVWAAAQKQLPGEGVALAEFSSGSPAVLFLSHISQTARRDLRWDNVASSAKLPNAHDVNPQISQHSWAFPCRLPSGGCIDFKLGPWLLSAGWDWAVSSALDIKVHTPGSSSWVASHLGNGDPTLTLQSPMGLFALPQLPKHTTTGHHVFMKAQGQCENVSDNR